MSYFVYYKHEYDSHGLQELCSLEECAKFIEWLMSSEPFPDIHGYIIIKGDKLLAEVTSTTVNVVDGDHLPKRTVAPCPFKLQE